MSPLRWGVPRLGRWLEGLEVVGAIVGIVGGAFEIYYGVKRSRAELEEHEHSFELLHDFTQKGVKHKPHSACACAPSYCCFGCGALIEQAPEGGNDVGKQRGDAGGVEAEEAGEGEPDADV
jgi:hypothetical protein